MSPVGGACLPILATFDPENIEAYEKSRLVAMWFWYKNYLSKNDSLNMKIFTSWGKHDINSFNSLERYLLKSLGANLEKFQERYSQEEIDQMVSICISGNDEFTEEHEKFLKERQKKDYLKLYYAYREVQRCYEGRKGKLIEFVSADQWENAKSNFKKIKADANLNTTELASVEEWFEDSVQGQILRMTKNTTLGVSEEIEWSCNSNLMLLSFGY